MHRRNLRLILCIPLMIALLLTCACTTEQAAPERTEEEVIDPSIERDAQILIDTLTQIDYEEKRAIQAISRLRELGVGQIVTFEIIEDEELSSFDETVGVVVHAYLTDDTGTRYRIGFTRYGTPLRVILPDGSEIVLTYDRGYT